MGKIFYIDASDPAGIDWYDCEEERDAALAAADIVIDLHATVGSDD